MVKWLVHCKPFSASLLVSKTDLLNQAGPPAYFLTAPSAGIGKSLLAEVLGASVTGQPTAMSTLPDDKTLWTVQHAKYDYKCAHFDGTQWQISTITTADNAWDGPAAIFAGERANKGK